MIFRGTGLKIAPFARLRRSPSNEPDSTKGAGPFSFIIRLAFPEPRFGGVTPD
jgi:hypothetical protein